jgi:putative ABC transport system permease protein
MNPFALALRNLTRNQRRSTLTLLGLIIGGIALILFGGYVRAIMLSLQTGTIRSVGHIQLMTQGYFLYGSGDPVAYGITDYEAVLSTLRNDARLTPLLRVATPTLAISGVAGNFAASVSRTFSGQGIDPKDTARLREWDPYAVGGQARPLALDTEHPETGVIGTGLARVLQLCESLKVSDCAKPPTQAAQAPTDILLPDELARLAKTSAKDAAPLTAEPAVELLSASATGAPNVLRMQVAEAESQGVRQLDDIYVALPLASAQRLVYGRGPAAVTSLVLQLHRSEQVPEALGILQQLITEHGWKLEARTFGEINPSYGQIVGMFRAIFGFLAVLMGAVVLFSVSNTINMAVAERTVEIATLRAMGMRQAGIRRLFIAEGATIGIIGGTLALTFGLLLAFLINHAHLTWLPPNQTDPVPLLILAADAPAMLLTTWIGLVLLAVTSAWWPARRAARLEIVEGLRHA